MIPIVLAAGLGTRLQPYSRAVSKPAMPVAGVPVILRVIEQCRDAGAADRLIVIANAPEHDVVPLVEAHARQHGYDVAFGYQRERRGSAHALRHVPGRDRLDQHILIAACDNFFESAELRSLVAQHQKRGADGTMAVLRVPPENMRAHSNVIVEGERVVRVIEKPAPGDVASPFVGPLLYAFSPKILTTLDDVPESPRGEFEFQDAIQAFIRDGARVEWFELSRRTTLTTPDDLLALNEQFFGAMPGGTRTLGDATIIEPAIIDPDVEIGEGSTVGPNAHLMRGCRVGRASTVRHALVFPGAVVPDRTTVEHTLIPPAL